MLVSPKASGGNGVDDIALKRGRKMVLLSGCGVAVARLFRAALLHAVTFLCVLYFRRLVYCVGAIFHKSW